MRYPFFMVAIIVAANAVILSSCTPAKKVARYQYLLENKSNTNQQNSQVASRPPRKTKPARKYTSSRPSNNKSDEKPLVYKHKGKRPQKKQSNHVVVVRNRPKKDPRFVKSTSNQSTGTFPKRNRELELKRDSEEVIRTAMSYMGTPYLYGGTSRKGMDCSGLVCLSYRSIDKNLPRTSATQAETGKSVPRNKIRPGHLIFFSTSKGNRINHVGIVTEVRNGDIEFIHASSSRGVRIDKLSHKYWKPRFVKAVAPLEG